MQTVIFPSISLKTIIIWSFLVLTTFDMAASDMTFTIFAGRSFTVYLDRVPYAYSSDGGRSSAQTYILSDNISIIAVHATKDQRYPGMIASTTDSNYILTDSSWKCKSDVTSGDMSWTSYYFNDDYWYVASEYGVEDTNDTAIDNVRPDASWIWTYYNYYYLWYPDADVYCRRRIGRALTYITAPVSSLYFNGQEQFGMKNDDLTDRYTIHVPADLQVIGIKSNISVYGPDTGIIAFTHDGYIITNNSWKCTNQTPDTSWTDVCYNDSRWQNASTHFYNGVLLNSRGFANRIWTWWSSNDLLVYCRFKLGKPSCPISSTVTTVKTSGTATTKSITNSTIPDGENLLTTQRAHPDNPDQPKTTATSRTSGMNALDTGTTGAIIGGVVGGAVLLIVVLVVFIICFIKKRRKPVERMTGVALVENDYGESPSNGVPIPTQILPDLQRSKASASINGNEVDNHYENLQNNNRLTSVPPKTYEYLRVPPAKDDSSVRFHSSTGESSNDRLAPDSSESYDNFRDLPVEDDAPVHFNSSTGELNNPDVLNDTSAIPNVAAVDVDHDTTIVENDLYTSI